MTNDELFAAAGDAFLLRWRRTQDPREAFESAYLYLVSLRRQRAKEVQAVRTVPARARAIVADVCRRHDVAEKHVLGKNRVADVCRVRDEAAWELLEAGYSTTVTGWALNRDHSSIIAARDRFDQRLAMDPELRARVEKLTTRAA